MPKLPAGQARALLAAAEVARLATVTASGAPHIVPITFAVAGDVIYTAVDAKPKTTVRLRRLRNIAVNPQVSVLADHYEADWRRLCWCRADGAADVLDRAADTAPALALLAERYPQYRADPPAGPVIRIQVARWSAWAAAEQGRARAAGG